MKQILNRLNMNAITTQYDKAATAQYIEQTPFINHGFHEEWHLNGRLINIIKHDAIPFGMKLGAIANGLVSITEEIVVTYNSKKTKLKVGDAVTRSIIPICGRRKDI